MSIFNLSPADFIDKNSENVERTKDGAEGSSKMTVKNISLTLLIHFSFNIFSFLAFWQQQVPYWSRHQDVLD